MWSKISNALKRADGDVRPLPQEAAPQEAAPPQPSVLEQVREQHPNLSNFHWNDKQPESEPMLSPPSSPSKQGSKRGLFKRASRMYLDKENGSTLSLAKRVRSSLHINTNMNGSNMSLTSPTSTELHQPVFSSVRSIFKDRKPSAMQMQAAMNKSDDAFSREPSDIQRPLSPTAAPTPHPTTPLDLQRTSGSVRSILRDKNTPSSGQNVRFFSRDAYRMISPETSINNSSSDLPDSSFMQRVTGLNSGRSSVSPNPDSTKFHSANASPNMFSPASASPNGLSMDAASTSTPYMTPSQGLIRHSTHSPLVPVPPPELTGLFDFSAANEHGVHTIPEGAEGTLQDGAVEIDELGQVIRKSLDSTTTFRKPSEEMNDNRASTHSTASSMSIDTPDSSFNDSGNRSLGRKAGDLVFHSLEDIGEKQRPLSADVHSLPPRSASSLGLYKRFNKEDGSGTGIRASLDFSSASNRARALSERVFSRPPLEDIRNAAPMHSEDDIHVPSEAGAALLGTASNEQPDPFRADASNYYNAAAGFPNSPPKMAHVRSDSGVSKASTKSTRSVSGVSHHSTKSHASSKASRNSISGLRSQEEEDLILSLRTQLAYHQELTSQYEIDLSTRDEIVSLLNRKLKAYEEDSEKRTKVMRGMRRKVQELERACRGLEEQVDQSRQDSFERSVMDEASGDALRDLHRQINQLEKDKSDVEKREQEVREENEWLKVEMQKKEDVERNLEGAIEEAKKQVEIMRAADQTLDKGMGDVRLMMVKSEQEYAQEAERHHDIEVAWAEERARLVGQLEEMEALRKQLSAKESEVDVLKQEVEAQWTNTEKLTEKTEELQKEKDDMEREREHLKNEITSLEARTSDMEVEWTESENRRVEMEAELADVWQSREEIEKERDQLRDEVERERTRLEEVRATLESLEARSTTFKEERQFAADNASRLERMVQECEIELSAYHDKVAAKEQEIDTLRDELSSIRREHARLQSEQVRAFSDVDAREANAQNQLEESIRAQTEAQMEASALKERVNTLQDEIEKLRRQVHVLKQQSADQDVKMVQMERQHEQDNEDKLGLNIALDSKQQELELVKRKIGVCGTAGATPAAPARVGSRRDSAAFKTPVPARPSSSLSTRPPSSLSDTGSRSGKQVGETPSTVRPALGKSSRANVSTAPSTIKKGRVSESSVVPLKARPRPSLPSTASARPAIARTSAARAAEASTAAPTHRRVMSSASRLSVASKSALLKSADGNASDATSAVSDKENATPVGRRHSIQQPPVLVPA